MGKFKVGDRVRLTEDNTRWGVRGDTATVKDVVGFGQSYWLEFDRQIDGDRTWCCAETRLELIEPDAATTENWDFDPRRELKVGDRVRVTGPCRPTGKTGVFVGVHEDTGYCLIEFDDWRDGHDGFGKLAPESNNGWFIRPEFLELLPPTTAPSTEPEPDLSVRVVADTSQLDDEIDRILRQLKKVEKKARKLGIRLEFRDAA